jgi:hypothetical protein
MKKKPIPVKTGNDWLSEIMLEVGIKKTVDEVPPGWMTQKQIAAAQGVPMSTAFARMTRLMDAGLLQRKRFRVQCGRLTAEVWFYFKSEK